MKNENDRDVKSRDRGDRDRASPPTSLRGGMPPVLARSWHGQHVGFA